MDLHATMLEIIHTAGLDDAILDYLTGVCNASDF